MIRYYFSDKTHEKMQTLEKYKKGCWVYVEAPNEEEIGFLADEYNLDEAMLLDVLDEDEMPRVEHDEDAVYIFTRHAHTNNELHITTSPLLFILTKDDLIVITPNRLTRIDRFLSGKIDADSTKRNRMMLQLFDQVVDEYESKLNSISRQIKTIRSRLRVEEIRNKDFIDFVLIEDVLNEFMSALTPTNAILRRILLGRHIHLSEDEKDIIEDLLLNNEQSVEACKSSLKTIVNIREAYSTIMSNNLNRVIRLLTVLTVIISVPTLISSIYGMNVPLPFMDSVLAFSGIMTVSFILSCLLLLVFRNRNWI